jgi:hypothetical protein
MSRLTIILINNNFGKILLKCTLMNYLGRAGENCIINHTQTVKHSLYDRRQKKKWK